MTRIIVAHAVVSCPILPEYRNIGVGNQKTYVMIRVSFFYPNTPESSFDLDYFLNQHLPKVEAALKPEGLTRMEIDRGIGTPNPETPLQYAVIEHLLFNNFEEMQCALGTHSPELMADMPNFTNVKPVVQINSVVLN
jgi:uncharacterized protein (TIGR02118 family)